MCCECPFGFQQISVKLFLADTHVPFLGATYPCFGFQETSPEIQNRGTSGPPKRTCVSAKNLKKKKICQTVEQKLFNCQGPTLTVKLLSKNCRTVKEPLKNCQGKTVGLSYSQGPTLKLLMSHSKTRNVILLKCQYSTPKPLYCWAKTAELSYCVGHSKTVVQHDSL